MELKQIKNQYDKNLKVLKEQMGFVTAMDEHPEKIYTKEFAKLFKSPKNEWIKWLSVTEEMTVFELQEYLERLSNKPLQTWLAQYEKEHIGKIFVTQGEDNTNAKTYPKTHRISFKDSEGNVSQVAMFDIYTRQYHLYGETRDQLAESVFDTEGFKKDVNEFKEKIAQKEKEIEEKKKEKIKMFFLMRLVKSYREMKQKMREEEIKKLQKELEKDKYWLEEREKAIKDTEEQEENYMKQIPEKSETYGIIKRFFEDVGYEKTDKAIY